MCRFNVGGERQQFYNSAGGLTSLDIYLRY